MPRKTAKANPTNASEGMELITATEPLKTIEEAAKLVGVAEIRVLEMFSEALNLPEAMVWEVIPQEHESLLTEFKNQQDAFNSVRALEPEKEATPQATESIYRTQSYGMNHSYKQRRSPQKTFDSAT
jgi:hypothetical protein